MSDGSQRYAWLPAFLVLLAPAACGAGSPPRGVAATATPTCSSRAGGAQIQIQVKDETYRLWSTKPAFIDRAKELQASGKAHVALFNGLADGRDCDPQWTFHSDAADMSWPDVTTEVCDGRPSDVEGNKPYWLDTIKRWCPWSAKVLKVEDRR